MKNKHVKDVQLIATITDGRAETLLKDYALLYDSSKKDRVIIWEMV